MRYVFFVFWALVILFGVTFASLNAHTVTINYYFNKSIIYLPVLLLITLVIGVVLGFVVTLPALIRSKRTARRLKQRIKQIEQEVNNLRAIPIKETH